MNNHSALSGLAYYRLFFIMIFVSSCINSQEDRNLEFALSAAGNNRPILEHVLNNYEIGTDQYKAARFLIENMPGHCSYLGDEINQYYDCALSLMKSNLTPKAQRDSLLTLSKGQFALLDKKVIQDIKIADSSYLISNIDKSYECWSNGRWARILTFDQFCEWLLPYKCTELQALDCWRDTLSSKFSDDLSSMTYNDENFKSPFKAVDLVRNEIIKKVKPVGLFMESGYPMLSAETMSQMTFGRCSDYVNLAVLTYRSIGIPAVIDETPIWGRYRTGHTWYVIMDDKGRELPSEWDVSSIPGTVFFPYQRIPKVYRNTFALNPDRVKYQRTSKYKYHFSLFQQDVSDHYFKTSDIEIPIRKSDQIVEPYVYIASFSGYGTDWKIIDYGNFKSGSATFHNMGRDILYLILGFNGDYLMPVSNPFVLNVDGSISHITPTKDKGTLFIRRKYLETENASIMRQRILGGKIQASMESDFSSPVDLLVINSVNICDKMPILSDRNYRYWRYLAPNGSYGSIAELSFFDKDTTILTGTSISNIGADHPLNSKAIDGDWLSNYETESPDGNWIGFDFGTPVSVKHVRIVPRGDDNDIHPGDEYELCIWDGNLWIRIAKRIADDNYLIFDNIPYGALLWLKNLTRGCDERPFVFRKSGIEWW